MEQALLHTRQVHIILETLEENGSDLKCLVKRDCMNIWDVFAGPRLKNKVLTGNMIKTYLQSLEIFAKFIEKGLFYKKDLLPDLQRESIIALQRHLPDYRATIHRQTGNQTTTRQVDEAFSKLMPEDIQKLETSEVVKEAIKTLGKAVEHHIPSRNETI